LALTIGLLVFLVIDATHEGLEAAAGVPGSYQGVALFGLAALGAYIGLESFGKWLLERKHRAGANVAAMGAGSVLALSVAVGIGLHNFSEGLAIGAAFTLGEAALGSLLIIGFTLHNTTEGLAIVAPLARESQRDQKRVSVLSLMGLGLIGGAPTVAGAWLGGSVYSAAWAVMFLGAGVGAIAQVIIQILRQMSGNEAISEYLAKPAVLFGLLSGCLVMYSTGLLIG
jgi:zinc transporter ZupT